MFNHPGQYDLACALLNHLEGIHVHTLDLGSLYSDTSRTVESAIVQFFLEVRRHKPSIIFIPNLHSWWSSLSELAIHIFTDQMDQLAAHDAILLLCTGTFGAGDGNLLMDIMDQLKLPRNKVVRVQPPALASRATYFELALKESIVLPEGVLAVNEVDAFGDATTTATLSVIPATFMAALNPTPTAAAEDLPLLPKAPAPPPKKLSIKEIRLLHEYDESVFRRLRILLRDFMHEFLRCKDYKSLTKNLNVGWLETGWEAAH